VSFPGTGAPPGATKLILPERALVAIGGGKDSLVGLHLIQQAGIDVQPICVGQSSLIGDTVKAAGLPLLRIERTLAPELAEMNRLGAWNGHVPVTAINSAILLCASVLYGFAYIVFSNERSADEATVVLSDGTAINHQYAKSSAFETGLRDVIASQVSPDIEYFSILRPFSELEIVRRFCALSEFHSVYSSCNRNFHIDGSRIEGRWCLDCPKCRFTALSLALFLPPGQVAGMMGGDLLDSGDQADGFRALCGLGRDKPFECVGETGESRAAMAALVASEDWCDHAVVIALAAEIEKVTVPALAGLLAPSGNHSIPALVLSQLDIKGDAGEKG
ncbi:MAG: endonuclease domain-containing protein, partial [Lysobacterales bacterium]